VQRLRPAADWLARQRAGRLPMRFATALVRVQIFDRSMTLAAQAFTSVFPVLIMLAAFLGQGLSAQVAELAHLPEASRQVLDEALSHGGLSAFGVVGSLVVLLSSTGLARALARAYAAVWAVGHTPAGPRAAWRWLATVLTLAASAVGTRLLTWLTADLPLPRASSAMLLLVADSAVAVLVPWLLLGGAVPARLLAPGGIIFGLVMLVVRPVGSIYLPRALQSSAHRYGTIGVAFTYISWLYVIAFCLLLAAVAGQVVVQERGAAMPLLPELTAHRDGLQLFAGTVAIAIGVAAFGWPFATVHLIGFLFGLNLIVTGFIRAGLLLFLPAYPPLYRVLGIAFGILTGIVGILCLRNITGSVVLLVLVIAVGWLLDGLLGRPAETRAGWRLGTALALALGAIAVLTWSKIGLATFIAIGATVLIFVGIAQVAGVLVVRRSPWS